LAASLNAVPEFQPARKQKPRFSSFLKLSAITRFVLGLGEFLVRLCYAFGLCEHELSSLQGLFNRVR